MPASTITSPVRTRRRPSQLWLSRAWIHAPAVQATVAPVTAMLATTGVRWRTAVTIGSRPRNTHRHPNRRATSALTAGPTSPGATHAVDRTAIMRGRSVSGRLRPIAAYATEGTAPAPTPCSTRPATRTPIDGASPARARPAPNSTTPATNGTAGPRRSASRPAATMPITLPSMKPLNTQPYRRRPPRSRATTGMTVTTASASDATNVMVRTRPTVSARRCGAISPPTPPSPIQPLRLARPLEPKRTTGTDEPGRMGARPDQRSGRGSRDGRCRSGGLLVEPEADLHSDLEVAATVVLDA